MAFTPVATWGGEHAPFQLQGKKSFLHVRGHDPIHDALHGYAGGHLGFYGYLRVANASIIRRCGIGLLDLPDRLWRDDYDDQLHPAEAANTALEEAAEDMGLELP